ncbi:Hypothetical_protein [Hexamita inflata]|uniref:Hypothetical_protein n=1 Tax=Hexamita inflata TaxID=28002 RepID=A0ABP1HNN2_9EUKA
MRKVIIYNDETTTEPKSSEADLLVSQVDKNSKLKQLYSMQNAQNQFISHTIRLPDLRKSQNSLNNTSTQNLEPLNQSRSQPQTPRLNRNNQSKETPSKLTNVSQNELFEVLSKKTLNDSFASTQDPLLITAPHPLTADSTTLNKTSLKMSESEGQIKILRNSNRSSYTPHSVKRMVIQHTQIVNSQISQANERLDKRKQLHNEIHKQLRQEEISRIDQCLMVFANLLEEQLNQVQNMLPAPDIKYAHLSYSYLISFIHIDDNKTRNQKYVDFLTQLIQNQEIKESEHVKQLKILAICEQMMYDMVNEFTQFDISAYCDQQRSKINLSIILDGDLIEQLGYMWTTQRQKEQIFRINFAVEMLQMKVQQINKHFLVECDSTEEYSTVQYGVFVQKVQGTDYGKLSTQYVQLVKDMIVDQQNKYSIHLDRFRAALEIETVLCFLLNDFKDSRNLSRQQIHNLLKYCFDARKFNLYIITRPDDLSDLGEKVVLSVLEEREMKLQRDVNAYKAKYIAQVKQLKESMPEILGIHDAYKVLLLSDFTRYIKAKNVKDLQQRVCEFMNDVTIQQAKYGSVYMDRVHLIQETEINTLNAMESFWGWSAEIGEFAAQQRSEIQLVIAMDQLVYYGLLGMMKQEDQRRQEELSNNEQPLNPQFSENSLQLSYLQNIKQSTPFTKPKPVYDPSIEELVVLAVEVSDKFITKLCEFHEKEKNSGVDRGEMIAKTVEEERQFQEEIVQLAEDDDIIELIEERETKRKVLFPGISV